MKYTMCISAECSFSTEIEMTPEEAKIVKRVLDELNSKNDEDYTGSCWIEMDK